MEILISLPTKETQFKVFKAAAHVTTAVGSLFVADRAISSQELLNFANTFPAPRVAMAQAPASCDAILKIQANYFDDHGGQPETSKRAYQARVDTPKGPVFRQTVDIRAGGPPVSVLTNDEGKATASVTGLTEGRTHDGKPDGKPAFEANITFGDSKTPFIVPCDSITPVQLWQEGSAHSGKEFLRSVDQFFQAIAEKIGPFFGGMAEMIKNPAKIPHLSEGTKNILIVGGILLVGVPVLIIIGTGVYGLARRGIQAFGRFLGRIR
jgi:hypothetical protein